MEQKTWKCNLFTKEATFAAKTNIENHFPRNIFNGLDFSIRDLMDFGGRKTASIFSGKQIATNIRRIGFLDPRFGRFWGSENGFNLGSDFGGRKKFEKNKFPPGKFNGGDCSYTFLYNLPLIFFIVLLFLILFCFCMSG